jgi:hypothetical protein
MPMKGIAVVSLNLPIRIQVPDNQTFVVPRADGPCQLSFTEKPAPTREDGIRADGFDDGKGTYLRSAVTARFELDIAETLPLTQDVSERLREVMRLSAWEALQAFLRVYAYVSHHLESLIVLEPEAYNLDLIDPASQRTVDGFPVTSGQVLLGPLAVKATLNDIGLAQLHALLQPGRGISLPDEILLRAETEVRLQQDLDHAILDVASALEIFVDQIIERESHFAPNPSVVRRLRREGIYSAYDKVFRVLGRPSLKDAHPRDPPEDKPLAFELLEFVFAVRNNIIHRGVRQFTLDRLSTRTYRSPYLKRHKRREGLMVDDPREVLGLVKGAHQIMSWVRTDGVPQR